MAIIYEKQSHIAIITLNRPEALNALDAESLNQFCQAIADFGDDHKLWVAIITGAGSKAFCAGADLKKLAPAIRNKTFKMPMSLMKGLTIWKPVIAAVNGIALGGGLEVALACDIRIAADNATLGLPEVKLGLIPGWGGTQRLSRVLSMSKAAELLFMGTTVNAEEALQIGLVNKVVPLDDLMTTAMSWAERICENGPLAVQAAKEALIRGADMNLQASLRLEEMLSDWLYTTADATEGLKAFTEKRKPNFSGQ
ncbi:enoyl-CoA hydratase/isomerase family protein [Chloroflexota bacterium]